jgi:hypothetical protein
MAVAVTIADHTRVYTDRTVAITGAALTTYHDGSAIAAGDTVYVYYDDPDRTGGAVTFMATATSGNAVSSAANPARHYVGTVVVPATGTSTGTTSTPGGTGGLGINHIDNGLR